MPEIEDAVVAANDAQAIAWEARDAVAELKAEVAELKKQAAELKTQAVAYLRRTERNDKALIAYAQAAHMGPSHAFTAAFEILDGGH